MRPLERDATIGIVGRRAVLEALAAPEVEVELVRLARGAPAAVRTEVQQACKRREVRCEVGSAARLRELADEPRHDQGVAARVTLREVVPVEQAVAEAGPHAHWLALDGITNPSNAGMIARSAAASGMAGLLWPRIGTPWLAALVVKASAGAVLRCRIARSDALADGLDVFRAAGFACIGLDAERGDDLYATPVPPRAVYVVGAESEGLSRGATERLDASVRIPIDERVESLNAAVAAALVCFHVSNSHR